MKGYSVYNAIKQLKDRGFKKAAVARQRDINRITVDRYWDMTIDEYMHWYAEKRIKLSLDGLSPLEYRRRLGLIG